MKETYELMPWYTKLVILIRRETEGKKAEQIIKEGLAVAVEYAVYQKSGKVNQPSDIKNFTKIRYPSKKAAAYRQGVERLKNKKIIKTDGMLDFGQIELDQKIILINQTNEYPASFLFSHHRRRVLEPVICRRRPISSVPGGGIAGNSRKKGRI